VKPSISAPSSKTNHSSFGSVMIGREFEADTVGGYRFGFNGQEKSDEIKGEGNSYTAMFWEYDPRIGRRWNTDPLKQFNSPYVAFGDNPILYIDPTGAWVPGTDKDNNVTVTKEKGDTKKSLAKFMGDGYSKKEIKNMWKSMDKETTTIDLTKQVGGVFQEMTTAMNEAKDRNNPTNADYDNRTLAGKNRTQNYNCWGTCIALNEGKKLETGVGIKTGAEFDSKLTANYTATTQGASNVGKTVIRYADATNTAKHGAIFMGVDNSGNVYLFSKNGWDVRPEIHTTKYIADFLSAPTTQDNYGTIIGINAGESGYYNKK